jgi:acyl-CoA synthetase (AMP-forming)/AMP-acid ligase II
MEEIVLEAEQPLVNSLDSWYRASAAATTELSAEQCCLPLLSILTLHTIFEKDAASGAENFLGSGLLPPGSSELCSVECCTSFVAAEHFFSSFFMVSGASGFEHLYFRSNVSITARASSAT